MSGMANMTLSENHRCRLANGFTLLEKLYAQISFFGILITGTWGIISADPVYALPYLLIGWYGVPGIIQRHLVCPRCPHLKDHHDCLQLHPAITRWLVKEWKPPGFTRGEKAVFLVIFILIPAYPLFWLVQSAWLFVCFLFFVFLWYGGQFFYFCRRCRVFDCPFNRTGLNPMNGFNKDT